MNTVDNPGIASPDEVAAALAEAQSNPGSIPSLDEARRSVVPVPVEPPAVKSPRLRPGPQAPPATPTRATSPTPTPTSPTPPPEEEQLPAAPRAATRWLYWLYRAADAVLWALNRPFERFSDEWRRLVGIVAIITLVIALTTAVVASNTRPQRTGEIPQLERLHANPAP